MPDVGRNTIHANDGSSQTRSAVLDHLRECYLDRVEVAFGSARARHTPKGVCSTNK
jgi:hypothetical protein